MTETTLPAVAKSFNTFCKKCDVDRYHKVIAHKTETSAKVECEVCHSKSTYSLPKAGAKAKATGVKKRVGVRRATHADEFNALLEKSGSSKGTPFSIKTKFETNQKIDHPKFGAGFVKTAQLDRIDVIFLDEVKTLIHNKV